MFKILVLIVSTVNPANYGLGISNDAYPTEEICKAAEPSHKADAEKAFPVEAYGERTIAAKCFPAEKAQAIYDEEVAKAKAKQLKREGTGA